MSASDSSQNRVPKAGDIVAINYGDTDFTRDIINIRGNIIYFRDFGIVWQNNRWEFSNGQEVQHIKFFRSREERLQSSTFTGSQLTDMHILAEADDRTFHKLCKTNLRMRDICTNPRLQQQLYEMRVKTHFPTEYSVLVEKRDVLPSWKRVYQKLDKMDAEGILSLLTTQEPLRYFEDNNMVGGARTFQTIMSAYPDIFKFVYPINPIAFSFIRNYANEIGHQSLRNWREILESFRWLLESNYIEVTPNLTSYAIVVGYGPFIKYLIEQKGVVLTPNQKVAAIHRGAGDIFELLDPFPGQPITRESEEMGMGTALEMGNIEGLEAFHNSGATLEEDDLYDRIDQYPEETTEWLMNHGYRMADDIILY